MGNCLSSCAADHLSPFSGVKVLTVQELRKATKDFGDEMAIKESFDGVMRGCINPKTLSPAKEGLGMTVAVKFCYLPSGQALQEWLDFNARVSYNGLETLASLENRSHVPFHEDEPARYHYAPPEYFSSGKFHMAGDVYSFGVILLEILTGFEIQRIILAKQAIRNDEENIVEMFDSDLENSYPLEAGKTYERAYKQCLKEDPKN